MKIISINLTPEFEGKSRFSATSARLPHSPSERSPHSPSAPFKGWEKVRQTSVANRHIKSESLPLLNLLDSSPQCWLCGSWNSEVVPATHQTLEASIHCGCFLRVCEGGAV